MSNYLIDGAMDYLNRIDKIPVEPDYTCLCCGMGFYKGEGVCVDNNDFFFLDCNWKDFVRQNYDGAMSKEEIEIRIAEAVLV